MISFFVPQESNPIPHMKITKAYQFRLYLTKEQEILIHKTFGYTIFLYNQMLKEKKKAIDQL